jgi:hypothetical protein
MLDIVTMNTPECYVWLPRPLHCNLRTSDVSLTHKRAHITKPSSDLSYFIHRVRYVTVIVRVVYLVKVDVLVVVLKRVDTAVLVTYTDVV